MTSHGSWIDQDEINHLVNSLGKKESQPLPSPPQEEPAVTSSESQPEPTPAESELPKAEFQPVADSRESGEPAAEATTHEAVFESAEEEQESVEKEEEFSPGKANVVNVLKEARKRANRGGLLRGIKKGVSPLWPDFPPLEEEKDAETIEPAAEAAPSETVEETAPPAGEAPVQGPFELGDPDEEPAAAEEKAPVDITVLKNLSIRKRLEGFADQVLENLDASSIAITDFQGYPLLMRGSKEGMGTTTAATLVTDQLNQLSEAVGAPELSSTQISLAEDRWLCLVEAQSATGGVLAQLQIPEPLDSGKTRQFRQDLETVLSGWN